MATLTPSFDCLSSFLVSWYVYVCAAALIALPMLKQTHILLLEIYHYVICPLLTLPYLVFIPKGITHCTWLLFNTTRPLTTLSLTRPDNASPLQPSP